MARKKNAIEMHSIHNKWKSVSAERFIKTLKRIKFIDIYDFNTKKCVYS